MFPGKSNISSGIRQGLESAAGIIYNNFQEHLFVFLRNSVTAVSSTALWECDGTGQAAVYWESNWPVEFQHKTSDADSVLSQGQDEKNFIISVERYIILVC